MSTKTNKSSDIKIQKTAKKRPRDDSTYILKLVVCLILGSIWISIGTRQISFPIPLGALIGLSLIKREQLSIDRKIEYAILLLAMFIGFWLPTHINILLT